MNNKGYIYFWRKDSDFGKIRVCSGDFAGLNVDFSINDCDDALQTKLRQINISRIRDCPPPSDALCVTCSFGVIDGDFMATNVSETTC